MKIKLFIAGAFMLAAWVLFAIAGFASPVSFFYCIINYAFSDITFKLALGSALILWIKMIACLIPGIICWAIAGVLE